MITQEEQKRIIEEFTKVHNVSMLALSKTLECYSKSVVTSNNIEDIKLTFECFIYDLNSVNDLMQDNMELLWEIKDK